VVTESCAGRALKPNRMAAFTERSWELLTQAEGALEA
jgi:hypothetical protein